MALPNHKTKIVATIGPASDSPEMLERLKKLTGEENWRIEEITYQ